MPSIENGPVGPIIFTIGLPARGTLEFRPLVNVMVSSPGKGFIGSSDSQLLPSDVSTFPAVPGAGKMGGLGGTMLSLAKNASLSRTRAMHALTLTVQFEGSWKTGFASGPGDLPSKLFEMIVVTHACSNVLSWV